MVIKSIVPVSYKGMYKIQPEEGSAFYSRNFYLSSIKIEFIEPGTEFTGETEDELLDSGLCAAVEFKAVQYLARAEQCRFKLLQKLIQKGYEKKYADCALSYLESENYLSDARFSRAWLNGRKINHYEGSSKLISELMSRGISKEVACAAVDDFFEENDELDFCCKAYQKFCKNGKSDEKLIQSLLNSGFSYKMIKEAKEIVLQTQ